MNNVIYTITENYPALSKPQKRIANFILKNPQEVCFLSLKELSLKVETTEKTIINFTKKLGFESYTTLKKDLQTYISSKIAPDEKVIRSISTIKKVDDDFIKSAYQIELNTIKRSFDYLNFSDIYKAASLIQNARKIYFVSHNTSRAVTQFLSTRLRSIGLNAQHLSVGSGKELAGELFHSNNDDVFIVVSFATYHKTSITLSEFLHKRGSPVISITDSLTSPIANNSIVSFACATDSAVFFNSCLGAMLIANILSSAVAVNMDSLVRGNKEKLKEIAEAAGISTENII